MYIEIEENGPVVRDVPEGNVILFFAKIDKINGYCVIYCPETCLSYEGDNFSELWDANVALGFEGPDMNIYKVRHGHKYARGGGFVEFVEVEAKQWGQSQIFFRKIRQLKFLRNHFTSTSICSVSIGAVLTQKG